MKRLQLIATFVVLLAAGSVMAQSQDTVALNPFTRMDTVQVGQIISYTGNVHGSVGEQLEVTSSDENIVEFIDSKIKYKKKQVPGMTGGDAAWKTFLFEAKEPGSANIEVQEYFRGELTDVFSIQIVVIE
ncbi:MAG: hypothetical protein NXI10_04175 [bacterium]|nr:hypothetical protein [bacterium]